MCFWRGHRNSIFFLDFTGIFRRNSCGQEFLYLIRIPPESGRIPVPAYCCLARLATKEGSLLRKIWTKIDLFQPLSRTGLDHGFRCPLPLLAPPSLKVRAAAAAEEVMAEEAVLMVEALVDVSETTIATADADNIRQQTTINNRPGAQLCLVVATTEVGGLEFFRFFLFWRDTQNSKSEKNKEKQADHGLTVRLPVAMKKGGHYGP